MTTAVVRDRVLQGYRITIEEFDRAFKLHTADPELKEKFYALEKHVRESRL